MGKMKKGISPQHIDRLNTLREIEHAILEARSTQAIAEGTLNHIDQLLPSCQWVNIKLFDPQTNEAISLASYPREADIFEGHEHISIEDFRKEGDPDNYHIHLVDDLLDLVKSAPELKHLADNGMRTYMSIPLVAKSRLIGSFTVGADQPNIYTDECI
ncbi:MAG: GAF domain-containing protein, partial [Chloroflexota bacterium]